MPVTGRRNVVFRTRGDFGLGDVEIVVILFTRLFDKGLVHDGPLTAASDCLSRVHDQGNETNRSYMLPFLKTFAIISFLRAAVAQLDRVLGYEPRGRGFESCQPHHLFEGLPPGRPYVLPRFYTNFIAVSLKLASPV